MCQNEQCRHAWTCGCDDCEVSDNKLCECEHADHGDRCEMRHQRTVKTMYGTYKLCLTCYERGHMQYEPLAQDAPALPEGMEGF